MLETARSGEGRRLREGACCRRCSAASEKSCATKGEAEARMVDGSSVKSASLFLERKPATEYVTRPPKWPIVKALSAPMREVGRMALSPRFVVLLPL